MFAGADHLRTMASRCGWTDVRSVEVERDDRVAVVNEAAAAGRRAGPVGTRVRLGVLEQPPPAR
jgi:hypothetical protein